MKKLIILAACLTMAGCSAIICDSDKTKPYIESKEKDSDGYRYVIRIYQSSPIYLYTTKEYSVGSTVEIREVGP